MNSHPLILRRAIFALVLAALVLPTGCVRRRLAVQTNPAGALVFVDNQQIGTTPCSVDFTYYGTREIRMVKPGYETLTVNQPIPMPWYQIPPIDFVSENLWPSRIEDHRTVAFNLEPQVIVPTEQLLDRANQLRQETLGSAVGPAVPATPPPGMPTTPPPSFGPPPSYGPPPSNGPTPTPATGPTPLPPITSPPVTSPPVTVPPAFQTSPPSTFSPPPLSVPAGLPSAGPLGTAVPYSAAPGFAPTPPPGGPPSLTPFSAPALPASPPSTQQGPPIVSPPLR